jgi:hypothetical protein
MHERQNSQVDNVLRMHRWRPWRGTVCGRRPVTRALFSPSTFDAIGREWVAVSGLIIKLAPGLKRRSVVVVSMSSPTRVALKARGVGRGHQPGRGQG